MRIMKTLGNILFWVTLISPIVAFSLASVIGEADIFDVVGIVRYSWIMLLFIPIGIFSFLVGIKLKKQNQKYRKNYIIAFICVPLLIIFGSFRFIFAKTISYDVNRVAYIEEITNLELPKQVKIGTTFLEDYNLSYVKITDKQASKEFEDSLLENSLWVTEIKTNIKGLLPEVIQLETKEFEYFVFYNVINNEYNKYPQIGEYKCVFLAYDVQQNRFIILDGLKVEII